MCANLWLKWFLKKIYSLRWELLNDMWHATHIQINRGNSWLLMVRSQINNLTSNLSFGHNLCFNHPNESCKPILDVYIPRASQWYKELFNPMNFDPCNHLLKVWESIEIHLGVWRFIPSHFPHFHTLGSMKCDSRVSRLAHTFASVCLGCEPKVRVVTINI